jgi:lysozyme
MLNIIDVSEYQGHIDFEAVKDSMLVDAVIIRASQGVHTTDSKFHEYHDGFKSVGMPIGAYHFFEFMANPAQQAQHFLSVIDGCEGELIPMVDVEDGSLVGPSDLGNRMQWLHQYNQYLLDHMPCHNLMIYTPLSFWNDQMGGTGAFAGHPLFLAEYNNDKEPEIPRGFKELKLWQHTSSGKIPGITENTVDLSFFNGNSLMEIGR